MLPFLWLLPGCFPQPSSDVVSLNDRRAKVDGARSILLTDETTTDRLAGEPLREFAKATQSSPRLPSEFHFVGAATARCFARADVPTALARTYDDVVRRIHLEVWRPENEFRVGDTVETIAARLKGVVKGASDFARVSDKTSVDLLRAEVVCAWVRSEVEFYPEMNSLPGAERVRLNAPEMVLSQRPKPKGNCDGHSRLVFALGNAVGVKTVAIGGCLRYGNGTIPPVDAEGETVKGLPWNHGWNAFVVAGKWLPADLGSAWKFLKREFREGWGGKTHGGSCLPLDRFELELFLGQHYMLHEDWKIVSADPLQSVTASEWRENDTSRLDQLETALRIRDTERNKRLAGN